MNDHAHAFARCVNDHAHAFARCVHDGDVVVVGVSQGKEVDTGKREGPRVQEADTRFLPLDAKEGSLDRKANLRYDLYHDLPDVLDRLAFLASSNRHDLLKAYSYTLLLREQPEHSELYHQQLICASPQVQVP